MKKGIVLAQTFNNDNDAILFSLSCKGNIDRSGLFIDLAHQLMSLFTYNIPSDLSEALKLDFSITDNVRYSNLTEYVKDNLVDDVLKEISYKLNDDIQLEEYNLFRIDIGRDLRKIFLYKHPTMTLASAVIMGGSGRNKEEDLEINRLGEEIAKQIALTNPLGMYSYELLPSIFNIIKLNSIEEALQKNLEEAVDDIVTSNINNLIKNYIIEEQINKKGITYKKLMQDYNIYFSNNFIRIELK